MKVLPPSGSSKRYACYGLPSVDNLDLPIISLLVVYDGLKSALPNFSWLLTLFSKKKTAFEDFFCIEVKANIQISKLFILLKSVRVGGTRPDHY